MQDLLRVDALQAKVAAVSSAMVSSERLLPNDAYSTMWKDVMYDHKFAKKKKLAHDRQELYTNVTYKFLHLWAVFVSGFASHGAAPEAQLENK